MDRYQKVEKPKAESPINPNEIRITSHGPIRNYINYAIALLQDERVDEMVLKAMGQAISKTVAIAEILKKRIPCLHQDTAISSLSITDVWEPIEEGLVPVEMTRSVSMISITMSTKELNVNSVGYQAPHSAEQVKPQYHSQQQQPPKQAVFPYNTRNEDSYGRGRGRGRGTGRGRSWGRGGYGNYQDNGGYSNWGRGGGRGRARDYRGGDYERGRGGGYERGRGGVGYERSGYEGGGGGGYKRDGRGGGVGFEGGRIRGYGRGGGGSYGRGAGGGYEGGRGGGDGRGVGGGYEGGRGDGYGRGVGGGYEGGNGAGYEGGRHGGRDYERGRGGYEGGRGYERGGGGRGYGRGRGRMGSGRLVATKP